jgi:multicomponent Na+:H+ antiporter subunit G
VNWPVVLDWVSGFLLIVGAFFSFAAGLGLLRFPDLLSRLHSASKPQVLGLASVLLAVVLQYPIWGIITSAVLVMLFQMMTIPASTHMVGRAAYRTKHLKRSALYKDELAEVIEKADRTRSEDPGSGGNG